jgi:hypothetical protein
MRWYSLDLLNGVSEAVEDTWKLAWAVTQSFGEPDCGSAIFLQRGPRDRLTLYFSPEAHELAEAFGAVPCQRPSPAGMTLLAGDERAWQIHYGRVFGKRATRGFEDTIPSGLADVSQGSPLQ